METTAVPAFTEQVFRQVLVEIYRQLAEVCIADPVPLGISLQKTLSVVERFLAEHSGGDRAQAVACALFRSDLQHRQAWRDLLGGV